MSYLYIVFAVILMSYGQLIFKWRILVHGDLPDSLIPKVLHLLVLFLDPYIFSGLFAAFVSALCYMTVLSKLPLSHVYPFMGATFALVLMGSSFFLNETMTFLKIAGIILIITGIAVGSQG